MTDDVIRPAFSNWPAYAGALRDVVGSLSVEELATQPAPGRWPLWASIGHLACQRVFWLCDFAGEPGADATRFTDAAHDCPGDDDLKNVLSADTLVADLNATFAIVERSLDRWTLASLDDVITHP